MRVSGLDVLLAIATGCLMVPLSGMAIIHVLGASLSGGDFPRTTPGEWATALGAAGAALAAPALVSRFAWSQKLWLTFAVQVLVFLGLSVLALWWFLQLLVE